MRKIDQYIFLLIVTAFLGVLFMQGCNHDSSQEKNPSPRGFEFKETLSEYGFFKNDLKEFKPAKGVIPYNIITPLFTDYAVKDRFIFLPESKFIRYAAHCVLDFPDSTFLIKSFSYINLENKKVIVETRLLFKDPDDHGWKVMNYLWNDEQTEAKKLIIGAKIPIELLDNEGNAIATTYQVPNVNDCKRCHISYNDILPIGPKARNLNYTVPGDTGNQLGKWASAGILQNMPSLDSIEKLPDWTDKKRYTVNERARAYLDVNCSYCHTKGGDAYNTGLFLEYEQKDPNHIGLNKLPVSAGGGAGGLNYDIIAGDPENSILLYRMNSVEPGTAMPELTRTIIHKEGVALIREWIKGMKKSG